MKRKIMICAALFLALTMMSDAALSVNASSKSSTTSSKIKDMESQINKAKEEKKEIQGNISDLKKLKESLEEQKGDLTNYVARLDENVARMEENITNLKNQIVVKEAEIEDAEQQLTEAQEIADSQYDSMRSHIRIMYEVNTASSIWSIFSMVDSFVDFLNMADKVNRIYAYDQQKWEEYLLNYEYIDLCREQLELEKEILSEQQEAVEEEQARIETLIEEKSQEITKFESDIKNKEKAIKEYEDYIAGQNEIIAQLEKAVADEKKKLEQEKLLKYDGGMFKFPLASYTRISDDYGYRMHPILNVQQFHNGVDFAAPKGTAIYAAYDGVVIAATYSSSMGNYVMIDHGDGLYTIYMHASKLYVKSNATVKKGDTIAAVGSTGRSTGNHLHFGVRLNGSYVSPWDYLSK